MQNNDNYVVHIVSACKYISKLIYRLLITVINIAINCNSIKTKTNTNNSPRTRLGVTDTVIKCITL